MTARRHFFLVLLFLGIAAPALGYQQIEFVREIGEARTSQKNRLMSEPSAVAISGDTLYIADTDAHRILVLDKEGKTLRSWGSRGDKPGQFKSPAGIAVDEQGRVYVADTDNDRIQVFTTEGKLLMAFGSGGSDRKQFSQPRGLAASHGLLYVADRKNSRVQVLTWDGIFIRSITFKSDKDELKEPVDLAVDVRNFVYVLDRDRHRVRIFDAAGDLVSSFGKEGGGMDGFDEPSGLAVDIRGNVYIADTDNYKVKKFDPKGVLVASIGTKGDGPGQFRNLKGITVDRDGSIFALDAKKNTLQVFSGEDDKQKPLAPQSPAPTVEFIRELAGTVDAIAFSKRPWGIMNDSIAAVGVIKGRTIGSRGKDPGQVRDPKGLFIDSSNNFWVADTDNSRIQKFGIEGNLLQVIGESGKSEGEFRDPHAVSLSPKGNIRVVDTGNRRVQVFSPKGLFLGSFGKSGKDAGQFNEPVDAAGDSEGNLYVVDRGNDRISKYDSNGKLLWEAGKTGSGPGEFEDPESIVVSPDNEIYVLDAGNHRIQVFNEKGLFLRSFGNEGKGVGEFKKPRGLALEGGTILYVGDRGNNRVQVFTLKHTPATPGGLSAKPGMNEVQLSWKPNTETYLEQYRIFRAEFPGGALAEVGASLEPFYVDRNLPSNRSFQYLVAAQALNGHASIPSEAVTVTTPKLVPATPRSVRIEPAEKQMVLSWLPNPEPYLDHYRVYRALQLASGFELVTKTAKTRFVDMPLLDETTYYYQIAAVGREGDESRPTDVAFASTPKAALTLPPLEITKIEMGDVFASAYKYYAIHPLGKITLTNNTDALYPKVKVSFSIKEYMDYATESEVDELKPGQSVDLPLLPLFNNKILDVTENTSLQSEIGITTYLEGEPRTVNRSFPVTLYERHAMTWDRKEKVGAFVTPRDPVVADFARSVIQPYVDAYPNLHSSLVYARAIYAALGVYGLSYIVDPTSPYQEFSEKSSVVDYLQYPRDTFSRKSGDCDDLSILFAASLENIGIGSALVDVPGHVFAAFNTGVLEKDRDILGFPADQFIIHRGTVWIPVEMTIVGAPFTRAWQKGAEQYQTWSAKGKAEIIEIQKAWEQFKPVTLPSGGGAVKVKRDAIEAKFKGELDTLGRKRLTFLSEKHLAALKKNPKHTDSLSQLGILYGENGMYAEAAEQFQKMLGLDKNNAVALNNMGNIDLLQEKYEEARKSYEAALAAAPKDTGIMVNLSRAFDRLGKRQDAKMWFQEAAEIDPRVLRQYGDLAENLGVK